VSTDLSPSDRARERDRERAQARRGRTRRRALVWLVRLVAAAVLLFAGIAIGQAFYGPLSDAVGRKPALWFGLLIFIVSSVGCAWAESVRALVAFRFLQALGGCAPIVVPRAVVRDHFDQVGSIRMLSMLMLVMGLAPILAPAMGGQLLVNFGIVN